MNKRLRKYISEINALRFTIFHIAGAKNGLSDRGSRFTSGGAGYDKGESPESTKKSDRAVGDKSTIKSHTASSDFQKYSLSDECPLIARSLPADCPQIARIFAYGAFGPAFDADYMTDDIGDSDDYES